MMDCKAHAIILSFHEMRILDLFGDTSVLDGFTVNTGKDGAAFYTMEEGKKNKAWKEIEYAFDAHERDMEDE